MRYLMKISLYLFVSTTMLIFGYEVVKFARDQVRITNAQTLSRVILMYQLMENRLPPSGGKTNVSQFLYKEKLIDQLVRDPVFTNATVLLDQFAFALIKIYDQIIKSSDIKKSQKIVNDMQKRFPTIFSDTEDNYSENIARLKALITDSEVQNNLRNMRQILDLSDHDLRELRSILKDADLKSNIEEIRKLASQPIPPECVIAYQSDSRKNAYEISMKLESLFNVNRMKEDGGNDDKRFEVGNDIMLNTALIVYGSKVIAQDRKTSIIK
jgi:hypothetical protein